MNASLLDFALRTLATYRLTRMVWAEDGPADVFQHWRDWVYSTFDPDHWVARGANCPLCLSVWLAGLVSLLPAGLVRVLAVAAAVALMFERGE